MVWIGEGHRHEMIAVPGVALGDGDALVAVEMSTICGSDVHTVQGRLQAPVPLVLGHESVGRVIAIGDAGALDTSGTPLRIGDRVVWSVTVSCGSCDRCDASATAPAPVETETPDTAAADADGIRIDSAVHHGEFGTGTVMGVEEDRLTVFFPEHGYKVLARAAFETGVLGLGEAA